MEGIFEFGEDDVTIEGLFVKSTEGLVVGL